MNTFEAMIGVSFKEGYSFSGSFLLVSFLIIGVSIYLTQREIIKPKIRRLPAIDAIDELVGRCAEMGKPLHYSPGISGLGGGWGDKDTVPGLAICGYVARKCVELGVRGIYSYREPMLQPVLHDIVKEAHMIEGNVEEFVPEDIVWLSPRQFAYAAGLVGLLSREKPAASMLLGAFAAESLICTEAGYRAGAMQIAGTTNAYQIPYFATTCDYVLISEELQTAGVYITQVPEQVGTIQGQDISRLLVLALMIIGGLLYAFGNEAITNLLGK